MDVMVLNGDGIGPEIMNAAIKIINKLHENFGLNINPVEYDIGAVTLDNGKWDLDHILDEARKYKAILKAPMGDPKLRNTGGTEKALDVILSLRFDLDLYANVRPVRLLPGVESPLKSYNNPDSINYTIIRENSEGLYSSHFGGLVLRDELAIDNQTITRKGTERISRFAFELAKKTKGSPKDGKKSVVCVDKSNVLRSFAFFRKIFSEVSSRYNEIVAKYMYADAMAQHMIIRPDELNVIVTENMFGDVLSDLGAATVGGLGFAYSGNISDNMGMFEPVHGSAPDIAGRNIANPTAMIMSTSMMLDWLGFGKFSKIIEDSLFNAIRSGVRTPDMGGNATTSYFTESILKNM